MSIIVIGDNLKILLKIFKLKICGHICETERYHFTLVMYMFPASKIFSAQGIKLASLTTL